MDASPKLPSVFAYIDFKKYLGDYYEQRKQVDPGFTHVYVCHRLGQAKSRGYFNNVLKGRLPVSTAFVDRFVTLLELKAEEARYFRALVSYNQTTSAQEKEFFFDQLVQLNSTPHRLLDKDSYAYYKEWYHSAMRALLDIIDFKNDYAALGRRLVPAITPKKARESIELLKGLGIITKTEQGFWKPTDRAVSTGDFTHDAVIEQFQMKGLEHARNVLANGSDKAHRNITMTISLSDKAFERMSSRIQQFKSEIRSIVHKDEEAATKVYHINLNVFPMSS